MNSMDKQLRAFHKKIDADTGLKSKRRSLIVTSLILIIISWTGATIKEFSGLVAKIEVTNTASIRYLLLISIIYLMLRYFAYARTYHDQLRSFWVSRFMKDKRVFYHSVNHDHNNEQNIKGLLGQALNVDIEEEPGALLLQYENHKFPFWGRKITYNTRSTQSTGNPYHLSIRIEEEIESVNEIILYKFNDNWTLRDYIHLLKIEYFYIFNSYTHYREYFDLIGPYVFGMLAIVSTVIAPKLIG